MKTLKITVAKIVAIRVWNAIAKTIGWSLDVFFLLLCGVGIILCLIGSVYYGLKLWYDPNAVNWTSAILLCPTLTIAAGVITWASKEAFLCAKNSKWIGADLTEWLSVEVDQDEL